MEFIAPETLHAATKGVARQLNYVLDHNAFNVGELELHDDHVLVVREGNVNAETFDRLVDPVGFALKKQLIKLYSAYGDAKRRKDAAEVKQLTSWIEHTVDEHVRNSIDVSKFSSAELIKRNRKLDAEVEVDKKNGRYLVRVTQKIKHESLPAREVRTLVALRESIKRGEASRKLTKLVERSWLKLKH